MNHRGEGASGTGRLKPLVERVRAALARGEPGSWLAQQLFELGMPPVEVMVVFGEATGAPIGDLSTFDAWWDPALGVVDRAAFDAWAARVFAASRPGPPS